MRMSKKRPRRKLNLTLAPDVVDELRARSDAHDEPIGRIVDDLVRKAFDLPTPGPAVSDAR